MSLKGLRTQIDNDADLTRAIYIVKTCAIIHNFLLETEGLEFWEGRDMEAMERQFEREAEDERAEREGFAADGGDQEGYQGTGNNETRAFVRSQMEQRKYAPAFVDDDDE